MTGALESDSRRLLEALVVRVVLDGADSRRAVVERLRSLDPREVEDAIDRLLAEGALREVEEGRIFRRKKLVATRKGLERLAEARRLLEEARRGRITLDVDPAILALALTMLLGTLLVGEAMEAYAAEEDYEEDEWSGEDEEIDAIDLDLGI